MPSTLVASWTTPRSTEKAGHGWAAVTAVAGLSTSFGGNAPVVWHGCGGVVAWPLWEAVELRCSMELKCSRYLQHQA